MSFFHDSGRSQNLIPPYERTIVVTFEPDESGSLVRVDRELNTILDPLSALSYTDFEIQNMLKAGVPLKSLQISKDLRLGHDAEIDAFSERLESIADKFFNPKED